MVRTASSIFLLVLFCFSLFHEIILGTQPTTRIFTYVDVTQQRCRLGNRSQFVPLTEVPDLWACLPEYNAKVFCFFLQVQSIVCQSGPVGSVAN